MNSASFSDQQNQRPILLIRLMSRRRTWAILFVVVYTLLLYSSWNLLSSISSFYRRSASSSSSSSYGGLPALYASVLLGIAFGVLSMVAALGVVVPAMVVTWITVLVLLAFSGKRRRELVVEGKKLTVEIVRFVARVLIREGNFVAAVCAVLGYFVLVRRGGGEAAE